MKPEQPTLDLVLLSGTYAICRLPVDEPPPDWAMQGGFFSVTRTREELSVVCAQQVVPEGVQHESGWACLKVQGPLNFNLTGILASLASSLAAAGISLFAVSTFDTDYLLVEQESLAGAMS